MFGRHTAPTAERVLQAAYHYAGHAQWVAATHRAAKALVAVGCAPAVPAQPTPYGGTLRHQYTPADLTPTAKAVALLRGLSPYTVAAHGLCAAHSGHSPYTWQWRELKVAGGTL